MLSRRDAAIHIGLFLGACATTWFSGYLGSDGPHPVRDGIAFAATLMGILTCHEFGHYIVSRRRGIDVSLPYFIPMPPGITLGTLGAVIKMRSQITDRRALFDVGAAGPIAGLVVAIPLLVIGLYISDVGP